MYKLNKEEINTLKEIENKFEEIEDLFNDLNCRTQDGISQEHGEHTSLNHCIRWGSKATEELIKNPTLQEY